MTAGGLARGDELLLRYLYNDGTVQAALPMRVVVDSVDLTVAWLAPRTPIMYWATADGGDPRQTPLAARFEQRLTTAPRVWEGSGVLRVMPTHAPYHVIHFWTAAGHFAGWYINFEAPRYRVGNRVDTIDWHLDLWISPDRTATWKDEDEAVAAMEAAHLRPEDYQTARMAGEEIIAALPSWPSSIGDWRWFRPDQTWAIPELRHWCSCSTDSHPEEPLHGNRTSFGR